jgi:hypothetical protein
MQDTAHGVDANRTIADILVRSEKQGILGVSGRDFTRTPELLNTVNSLMSKQKMNGEEVNSFLKEDIAKLFRLNAIVDIRPPEVIKSLDSLI